MMANELLTPLDDLAAEQVIGGYQIVKKEFSFDGTSASGEVVVAFGSVSVKGEATLDVGTGDFVYEIKTPPRGRPLLSYEGSGNIGDYI
jgi:hypothetical protein